MKRIILTLATFLITTVFALAQDSPTAKLFAKYSGKDGFTTVSISKELFGLFSNIDSEDQDMQDVKDMMNQLEGIKILMYDADDGSENELANFRNEMSKFNLDGFSELMTVKEKGEQVTFLARKNGENVSELLLLLDEGDEAGFISITGNIDMNTVAKLSKTMKIEGMDKLEKLDENDK